MKARIDDKAKTIAIEESISMEELLKFVKFIAPNDWKTWKVETNVKFEFSGNPIVIHDYSRPWRSPFYYGSVYDSTLCGGTTVAANGIGLDSTTAAIGTGTSSIISQARQDGPTWSIDRQVAYVEVAGI